MRTPPFPPIIEGAEYDILEGFDFLLDEMAKRGMKAVISLNNFYDSKGGFGTVINQLMSSHSTKGTLVDYLKKIVDNYYDYIHVIMSRQNSINSLTYSEDPTIMAWQFENEPDSDHCEDYLNWIEKTSKHIKNRTKHQLVSVGNLGTISQCYDEIHSIKEVDYITFQVWNKNEESLRFEEKDSLREHI